MTAGSLDASAPSAISTTRRSSIPSSAPSAALRTDGAASLAMSADRRGIARTPMTRSRAAAASRSTPPADRSASRSVSISLGFFRRRELSLLAEYPGQADAEDVEDDDRSAHRQHADAARVWRQHGREHDDDHDRVLEVLDHEPRRDHAHPGEEEDDGRQLEGQAHRQNQAQVDTEGRLHPRCTREQVVLEAGEKPPDDRRSE